MKQSKISMAVAAAILVGSVGMGVSAADRISGTRVSEPSTARTRFTEPRPGLSACAPMRTLSTARSR